MVSLISGISETTSSAHIRHCYPSLPSTSYPCAHAQVMSDSLPARRLPSVLLSSLVPALGPTFVKANLKGRDLLKTYTTPMCVLYFRRNMIFAHHSEQTRKHGARLRIGIYTPVNTIYPVCILPDLLEWITSAVCRPRGYCRQHLPPLPGAATSSFLYVKVNEDCSFPFICLRFSRS